MNQKRFVERVAVLAGLFFLCGGPGLSCAQGSQLHAVQTPPIASPAARLKRDAPPTDYFAGLTFTEDQKAKIDEIHRNMKARVDTVNKDGKLDPEQKRAMLDGYRRMQNGQIFKLLTPEQQNVVRENVRAQRQADAEETKKKQSLPK